MGLPLIDGVFASIILSNGLSSPIDAILVGSFIFGGGATVGIIVSEFGSDKLKSIQRIILVSTFICTIAIIQVIVAPSIRVLINTDLFTIGSFVTLIALSIQILPDKRTDIVPSPVLIVIVFGLISINYDAITTVNIIQLNPAIGLILYTVIAVSISAIISILAVIYKDNIRESIEQKTLKIITSMGLVVIAFSVLGIIPSIIAPIVFIIVPIFNLL